MSDYTTSYLFAAIARGLCLKIVALVVDNQRPADDLVGAEASGIDGTPGRSCHGKKRRQISGMVRVWPMGWIVMTAGGTEQILWRSAAPATLVNVKTKETACALGVLIRESFHLGYHDGSIRYIIEISHTVKFGEGRSAMDFGVSSRYTIC